MSTDPRHFRAYRMKRRWQETHDTFTIELAAMDGSEPVNFAPGQFNMLYVFGQGEVPISISGDPRQPSALTHTVRAVGSATKSLRRLKAGEGLGVRGPYGSPWPLEGARGNDVVVVAGGIGLAPLRPALYELLHRRADYGQIVLLYGTRSPTDILYRKELARWRARFDLETLITVDRATDGWHGHVGVVSTLISKASFTPANTTALICGPEIMIRFTALALEKRGVTPENIYVSLERNMKCAVGFCGHCQFGPLFVCRDGPVFSYPRVKGLLAVREV
ncbi:MAG: FAD/NAD(P)-binding protein [Acidobacteria bacterium]|nr:FAD/NAD(P)-binding protein [Acidobacteriota bacterium]MBI3655199.1 FAD/NAD(P)-binding protein [Acidobacteriota bacterium]